MKNKSQSTAMRVAMLGQKETVAADAYRGGIEVLVEEIAPRLVERGIEVCCYDRSYANGSRLNEYRGVRIERVKTMQKRGLAAASASFFATVKSTFGGYDVIHIHAEGTALFAFLPAFVNLFRSRKAKIICHNHGIDWARACWGGGFSAKYIRWGEKIAAKFADELIVLSPNLREYFWHNYRRETVLIPNGVNRATRCRAQLITDRFGLEPGGYILFLGRIVPEKGLHYLIEAFKSLSTDKKLVIAGDMPEDDAYVQKTKALAAEDERILTVGFATGRLREELYSNAYLYCLPSDLEGMSLSLLEAMSYGNCCLVSDIPECALVVGSHGVVFQQRNIQSLREQLQMLCDSPELVQDYQKTAADYICAQYSWEKTTEQLIQLYGQQK